jgi:hypothetical protein
VPTALSCFIDFRLDYSVRKCHIGPILTAAFKPLLQNVDPMLLNGLLLAVLRRSFTLFLLSLIAAKPLEVERGVF